MSISISISTLVKRQKPNGAMASSCVVPVSLSPLRRLLFKHHLLPGARVGTVEQVTAPMASMGLNSHRQSLDPREAAGLRLPVLRQTTRASGAIAETQGEKRVPGGRCPGSRPCCWRGSWRVRRGDAICPLALCCLFLGGSAGFHSSASPWWQPQNTSTISVEWMKNSPVPTRLLTTESRLFPGEQAPNKPDLAGEERGLARTLPGGNPTLAPGCGYAPAPYAIAPALPSCLLSLLA